MKNLIYISLFICLLLQANQSHSQSHPYVPVPLDSTNWVETFKEHRTLGRFQINGKNYFKYFELNSLIEDTVGIRQDTALKRVYIWDPKDSLEHVLYDFNLNVGDTTYFYSDTLNGANKQYSYKVVHSIDTTRRLDGKLIYKYNLIDYQPVAWGVLYEGCGLSEGFYLGHNRKRYGTLNCVKERGIQIFESEPGIGCDVVSINEHIPNPLQITPNPSPDGRFEVIGCNQDVVVMVYNLQGKLMKSVLLNSNSTELDLSELESSLYLIKIGGYSFRVLNKM